MARGKKRGESRRESQGVRSRKEANPPGPGRTLLLGRFWKILSQ